MDPGNVVGYKLLEKDAADDRSGRAVADILEIGNITPDAFEVVVPQGQRPNPLANLQANLPDVLDQAFPVSHDSGHLMTQGDDAGAGKRGQIENGRRLKGHRISQSIA